MPAEAGDSEERRQSEDTPAPDDEPSNESDSERERPIDSDESLGDAIFPISPGPLSISRQLYKTEGEIQFELELFQAFRAIMNGSSSTLKLLSVCWGSFGAGNQYHDILPPLPVLEELHFSSPIPNGCGWW